MTRDQLIDLLKSIRHRADEDDPWIPGLILDLVDAIEGAINLVEEYDIE